MAVRRITKTDTSFGWATGANNWGTRVNEHLKRAAYQSMHFTVVETLNNAPSTIPVEGTVYQVGLSPRGSFSAFATHTLAIYGSSPPDYSSLSYLNFIPYPGWLAYHIADRTLYVYSGTVWVAV